MSPLRIAYLALAIWGAMHPMYWFLAWFRENGYSLGLMVDAWHANAASSGLVWDLTIAAIALTLWTSPRRSASGSAAGCHCTCSCARDR